MGIASFRSRRALTLAASATAGVLLYAASGRAGSAQPPVSLPPPANPVVPRSSSPAPFAPPSTAPPVVGGSWVAQGPTSTGNGQVEGIPRKPVVGAIRTLVTDPSNAAVLYAGAVNGGVWKTTNGTAANPTWVPLTDTQPSLSIGALDLDPANPRVVVAGLGNFSSFGSQGGPLVGLLLSIDAGANWSLKSPPQAWNFGAVAARLQPGGSVIVLAGARNDLTGGTGGLLRSTDSGVTWQVESGTAQLPAGDILDLVGDPRSTNSSRFYAAVARVGIFRSDDAGQTWTNVSSGDVLLNGNITGTTATNCAFPGVNCNNNTRLAVASNGRVYAAIIVDGRAHYIGFSDNAGANWTSMDIPATADGARSGAITGATNGVPPIVIASANHGLVDGDTVFVSGVTGNTNAKGFFEVSVPDANHFSLLGSVGNGAYAGGGSWVSFTNGLNPGAQGYIHFSITPDPTTTTTVFVGGDRQPSPFPNTIGASDYTGRLFRGDTTVAPTGAIPSPQWSHITHSNTLSLSAPHADSRRVMLIGGRLVECDDGGIYAQTSPLTKTGDWISLNGNLQVTEFHDIAYDDVSGVIVGGAQDTGTPFGPLGTPGGWGDALTGDGGDVAVDTTSLAGMSIRYVSAVPLVPNSSLFRLTYNAANTFVSFATVKLSVTAGDPPDFPFIAPLELNVSNQKRLVVVANNGVYESSDQGDDIQELAGLTAASPNSILAFMQNAVAYGHPLNAEILWVGSNAQIFVRSTAGGALAQAAGYPGGVVRDIAIDPTNAQVAYVLDPTNVYRTTDLGATWTNVTGSLATVTNLDLRTVVYVPGAAPPDRIVVGTRGGVYVAPKTNFATWFQLGSGIPTAPTWDLEYSKTSDLLVAGTLGRGAWTLQGVKAIPFVQSHVPAMPGRWMAALAALLTLGALGSVRRTRAAS